MLFLTTKAYSSGARGAEGVLGIRHKVADDVSSIEGRLPKGRWHSAVDPRLARFVGGDFDRYSAIQSDPEVYRGFRETTRRAPLDYPYDDDDRTQIFSRVPGLQSRYGVPPQSAQGSPFKLRQFATPDGVVHLTNRAWPMGVKPGAAPSAVVVPGAAPYSPTTQGRSFRRPAQMHALK